MTGKEVEAILKKKKLGRTEEKVPVLITGVVQPGHRSAHEEAYRTSEGEQKQQCEDTHCRNSRGTHVHNEYAVGIQKIA